MCVFHCWPSLPLTLILDSALTAVYPLLTLACSRLILPTHLSLLLLTLATHKTKLQSLIWLYITTESLTRLLFASAPVITVGSCHKPVGSSDKPHFLNLQCIWRYSSSSACPSCRVSAPTWCPPRSTRPATQAASSTINIYRHSCYSCPLALSVSFSATPGVEIREVNLITSDSYQVCDSNMVDGCFRST